MSKRPQFDDRIDDAIGALIEDDVAGFTVQTVSESGEDDVSLLAFDHDELDGKQQADAAERMLAMHLLALSQADDESLHAFANRMANRAQGIELSDVSISLG